MTVTEFLRSNAPNYTSKEQCIAECMVATGADRRKVSQALIDIRLGKSPVKFGWVTTTQESAPSLKTFRGLSESEIRAKHDTKFILEQVVKKLEKGLYITDSDFIKQCDIKTHVGYRQALDDPEFKKYKGKAGGITYWSHPDSIEKMKNEGILT